MLTKRSKKGPARVRRGCLFLAYGVIHHRILVRKSPGIRLDTCDYGGINSKSWQKDAWWALTSLSVREAIVSGGTRTLTRYVEFRHCVESCHTDSWEQQEVSEVKHNASLVNEYALWALLCEYHPQLPRDGLWWEAHQIAQAMEMVAYDCVRFRDRRMPLSGRWGIPWILRNSHWME